MCPTLFRAISAASLADAVSPASAVERTDHERCMQEAPEGKQNQDNR
jgi:hypothetical protein